MNDSYLTGTHLNDMTVFGPIFLAGDLVGFAASRAHWLDVGAKDAGGPMDSTEIYQEGIRVPPLRVVEGGAERADVVDMLGRNSRFSYPAIGDLGAQIACVNTGQARLQAIVERHGLDAVLAAREQIFAQTERYEREAIAAIPDGSYAAEGCLDNDGVTRRAVLGPGAGRRARRRDDDRPRRHRRRQGGPVNCGEAQAVSAARVAYKLLVSPDNPPDGGAFRALTVAVPRGSVLAAEEPAPCQWYFTPLGLLIDLVVKALAAVLPEQAAGASYGDSMMISMSGIDPRNGNRWLDLEPTVGGWGAWQRLGRRERADQQRQRLAQGHADRGLRDEVPDAGHRVRVPRRLRRRRALARRQRDRPRVPRSAATSCRCTSGSSARGRRRGACSAVGTRRRRWSSSTRAATTSGDSSSAAGSRSGAAT